jgi:cytosine/adenosine deaminase-related metal-dependent hydrolase
MIHAAEGLDAVAQTELETLDRLGCLSPNTVLIHGVAFCRAAADRVIAAGAGLVWCPSSNQFLFEATADVRAFDDADRLALGSDSRLSGAGDLLDELQSAHATRQLSAEGLARTIGTGAAQLLRLDDGGRIETGARADLTVIGARETCPFDTLVSSARGDVRLTMIGGEPAIAEPGLAPLFDAAGVDSSQALLDGSPRLVARWIARRVQRMQLQEPGFEMLPSTDREGFASAIRSGQGN